MTEIALFHSVLGVTDGFLEAVERFACAGHHVQVVDQYGGRTFGGYDEAGAYVEELGGYPALMRSALAGVATLPDGFVTAGFSNGGGMAEYVATQRRVRGALMFSGSLPLELLGVEAWPAAVPAQIHFMTGDPRRHEGWAQSLADSIRATADVDVFEYPGTGHLFTDRTLPDEYDAEAAELLWSRASDFLATTE
jgi:dienelactone hydrolase